MKALLHSNLTFLGIYLRQGLLNLTISSNVDRSVSFNLIVPLEHDLKQNMMSGALLLGKLCLWMLFLLNTTNIFGKGETTFEFGSKRSRIPCSTFENIQEVLYPSISQGHGLQCDTLKVAEINDETNTQKKVRES